MPETIRNNAEPDSRVYSAWDFRNGYVDPAALHAIPDPTRPSIYTGEDFVSSESILIAVGPKTFSQTGGRIYGVGVVQNFNVSQNKNIQQLYEIGSRDTILLPGRTFIQATIARILFNGPSLMKALYMAMPQPDSSTDYSQIPGDPAGHLWLNLAATYFNKPMGFALLMHDSENQTYGGVYLENCLLQAHNFTLASGQTVVAENCALRVGKVYPIAMGS